MKYTQTYYYQFGSAYTPDALVVNPAAPPADFPAPSGQYNAPLTNIDKTAHIPINVPFKVRTIHIKNITYVSGMAGNQGTLGLTPAVNFYINIISSLVGNRPVGMVHADSQFSMNTKQDIKHTFQIPQVINGIYDFSLYDNEGQQLAPYQYNVNLGIPAYYFYFDSFSITIEFNSEYEN